MSEYRVGPVGVGTVTINGTINVVGAATDFTDYAVGDALLVVLVSGAYVEKVISKITDGTHLEVSVAFSQSESGRSFYILRAATELFGGTCSVHNFAPRSQPTEGARRVTLAGTERAVGYARARWFIAAVDVTAWKAARLFLWGSYTAISGECLVETRDNNDVWDVYRALLNWPDTADMPRVASGGYYQDLVLPFVLLEAL